MDKIQKLNKVRRTDKSQYIPKAIEQNVNLLQS
ncbi:MAG: hypothetical protein ACJA1N_002520 [Saprospiraceae bacterium]|jgi:hypothetical protein